LDFAGGSSEDAVCSLPNDRSHPADSIVLKGGKEIELQKGVMSRTCPYPDNYH